MPPTGWKGTSEDRFWMKVDKNGPVMEDGLSNCWLWTGSYGGKRILYPQLKVGDESVRATRFIYERKYGSIPSGVKLYTRCNNTRCVRPDHLFLGVRGSDPRTSVPIVIVDGVKHKRCVDCNDLLPYTHEYFNSNGKNRLAGECKECAKVRRIKSSAKHWDRLLWYEAKQSASLKGLEFSISKDFILELYERQFGKCYWFGVDLMPSEIVKYPFQPSLDRLDRNLGYIEDNVVLCCYVANIGRNSSGVDVFVKFLESLPSSLENSVWKSDTKWREKSESA